MNKSDLIQAMSQDVGITKPQAAEALDSLLENIIKGLADQQSVRLSDFGVFSVLERSERIGRNPRTGEEITIPGKKTIKFKAWKNLNDTINKANK